MEVHVGKGQTPIQPHHPVLSRTGEKLGRESLKAGKLLASCCCRQVKLNLVKINFIYCQLKSIQVVRNKDNPQTSTFPSRGLPKAQLLPLPPGPPGPRALQRTGYAQHLPVSPASPSPSRSPLPRRGLSTGGRAGLLQSQMLLSAACHSLLFPLLSLTFSPSLLPSSAGFAISSIRFGSRTCG